MAPKKDDFLQKRLQQEAAKAATKPKDHRVTSVYLNGDLRRRLDKQVATSGLGQSSLIRVAIEGLLEKMESKK